jgi:ATP-dependent RNA helicase SUPV3L1/SUV3
MFAPDASAAGSEAKALNAAAQKALAGEIEARATRLSQASNDQIVLANDGTVRWLGDAVGRLGAGDDTLRPRLRILADEHLTGAARELVQTRLDLWLKTHIEKLLAPLFSLSAADDITGMARGVAYQLVEALGVLERQRVSDEVKGLDQNARATLRKYGVRFGAYHIYLPALLKPAPRSLATQLWALKHEAPDAKGVAELLHLAASGRTSIPVDKETPKTLFRTAGYRVTGERAVRVDILERLADLIRPALSWREGSSMPKPDGAVDGRSFTVTGAMTSLTGASGEDFASILRALGYRMERRPKPAEVPAAPAAEAATPEAAAAETPAAEVAAEVTEPAVEASAEPVTDSAALLPDAELMPTPAPVEEPAVQAAPAEAPAEAVAEAPAEAAAEVAAEAPAEAAAAVEAAPEAAEAAKAEEPAFIEVWRPGGRSEKRPPRHRRPQRPQQAPQAAAPAAEAAPAPAEAAAPAEQPATEASPRPERRDGGDHRQRRQERHERQQRMDRQNQRSDRPGQHGGPPRGDRPRRRRDEGPERAEREQYYAKPYGSGGGGRNKEPDPNSPFAKLAALKAQLEQKDST